MMRLPVTNLPQPVPRVVEKPPVGKPEHSTHRRVDRRPTSFYLAALRLNRVRPSGLQRILLIEGSILVGIVIALADVASAWVVLILPLVVAAAVKFEDFVATALYGANRRPSN